MIKVGIFFGGASREREVSFAGGRTVYDNLDKAMFQAIPIFVDAYGNLVELNWEYIYRGTIRDFFPPAQYLPETEVAYQIYSESLQLDESSYRKMLEEIGKPLMAEDLPAKIDFAFLALHGAYGEDGTLQGLLEWFNIPYSGSGVLASALGVSKKIQKKWWPDDLPIQSWESLRYEEWLKVEQEALYKRLSAELGLPFVVKSSNQGSSIGVQVINDLASFERKVNAAFFIKHIHATEWEQIDQVKYVQEATDLRIGLGLPMLVNGALCHHPQELRSRISTEVLKGPVELRARSAEYEVVFESFLKGREFSCIVIEQEDGTPLALPPTEVVKGTEIFDYSSKYLPGLSHKQTPINIEEKQIEAIRSACVSLYEYFEFEVYARIDGFITEAGIFLNDPNTTSGMMPSSFFFHQAAEIGLDPRNFITYIIRTSLASRLRKKPAQIEFKVLLDQLDKSLLNRNKEGTMKKKVAVLLGGYSTERHISVESGRNIYEKLASSVDYEPSPVFLSGKDGAHILHEIPVNIMLKDNADDIRDKITQRTTAPILQKIRKEAEAITKKYVGKDYRFSPLPLSYPELKERFDAVFIALHGRPGEDGQVQAELDQLGLPYNGSGVESSQLTINKFETNELLRANGVLVADHLLVNKSDWLKDRSACIQQIEQFHYPLICKPHDEGCSSAVIKINDQKMLETYADLCFELIERNTEAEWILGIGPRDEFPHKEFFMAEAFTAKGNADHFLEITGGMLTRFENGVLKYEVFEPSEALSSGTVLTLAEKFLAGEGQNITPARYSRDKEKQAKISSIVRREFEKVARILNVEGYCRIDAFVRIYKDKEPEVVIIEVNSLPGMTPATCIYHQAALNSYKPFEFIDRILRFGMNRLSHRAS